jgi:hypothetical protein
MQLRHECDEAAVRAVAAYLQDLSHKITPSESALSTTSSSRENGPEQVGVSRREAAEMRATEWAIVMATACCSAAEDGVFDPKESLKSASTATSASKMNQNISKSTKTSQKINFPALAGVIIQAHATLKNSAAPLRALPGGPRRRYLVELCEDSERYLALVEPVLMDAPYQTEAIEIGRGLVSTQPPGGQQTPPPPSPQQQQQQHHRGFRGALSSFIQNIKGVPGLNYECRIAGIDAHVIVEQSHYIAAVQRQAAELNINENVVALQRAIDKLKDAGRKGLFA